MHDTALLNRELAGLDAMYLARTTRWQALDSKCTGWYVGLARAFIHISEQELYKMSVQRQLCCVKQQPLADVEPCGAAVGRDMEDNEHRLSENRTDRSMVRG